MAPIRRPAMVPIRPPWAGGGDPSGGRPKGRRGDWRPPWAGLAGLAGGPKAGRPWHRSRKSERSRGPRAIPAGWPESDLTIHCKLQRNRSVPRSVLNKSSKSDSYFTVPKGLEGFSSHNFSDFSRLLVWAFFLGRPGDRWGVLGAFVGFLGCPANPAEHPRSAAQGRCSRPTSRCLAGASAEV